MHGHTALKGLKSPLGPIRYRHLRKFYASPYQSHLKKAVFFCFSSFYIFHHIFYTYLIPTMGQTGHFSTEASLGRAKYKIKYTMYVTFVCKCWRWPVLLEHGALAQHVTEVMHYVLGYWTKKETLWKLKGRALHWPNEEILLLYYFMFINMNQHNGKISPMALW